MKNLKKTEQETIVSVENDFGEVSKATINTKIDVDKLDWSMSVKIKMEDVRDEDKLADALAEKLRELMRSAHNDTQQFNRQMNMFQADDDVSDTEVAEYEEVEVDVNMIEGSKS